MLTKQHRSQPLIKCSEDTMQRRAVIHFPANFPRLSRDLVLFFFSFFSFLKFSDLFPSLIRKCTQKQVANTKPGFSRGNIQLSRCMQLFFSVIKVVFVTYAEHIRKAGKRNTPANGLVVVQGEPAWEGYHAPSSHKDNLLSQLHVVSFTPTENLIPQKGVPAKSPDTSPR